MNGTITLNYEGQGIPVEVLFENPKLDNDVVVIQIYSETEQSSWMFSANPQDGNEGFSGIATCISGPVGEYRLDWHTEELPPYEEVDEVK